MTRVQHPRAGEAYRPTDYWSSLHDTARDLGVVGYPTLPPVFNRYIYANAAGAVLRGMAERRVDVRGRRVLDVGSGTGFWIDLWHREGAAQVSGCDLVPQAVDRLRARFPESEFDAVDISERAPFPGREFDVVTVMSVLHHIVDEERFRSALASLGSQVASDGHVLVLDPLVLRGRWMPAAAESAHNVTRTLPQWESALEDSGLHMTDIVPVASFLFDDPVDAGSRLAFAAHRLWWRCFTAAIRGRDRLASAVVPPVALLDRAVVGRLRTGPGSKLLVLERSK